MKKAIAILLTALLLLTVFVSCEGDVEDLFGDNITITFNGNGSTSGQMAALKVARGKEVKLTANAYKKSDSEFTGWNTKADGSGYPYEDEEFVYFEEDTTLYAQWSSGVTITFDSNSGSGTMDSVKVSADVYELPENGFTAPEGYAFVRWSETADGEVEYEVGDELEVTEDVTLYAIWAEILTNTKTSWTGRYTINDNLDYSTTRIQVDNVAKLYLPDGLTLNAKKGITVTDGNTLVIDKVGTKGNGTLLIDGVGYNFAGIGGENYDEKRTAGEIIINGGNVTANGGNLAAGIGGASNGAGGTVTVTGGKVNANGGSQAAGIGGGIGGAGGTITINGGTVNATGGEFGIGIGAGKTSSSHGTLTIADDVIMMVSTNNTDWSVYDGSTRKQYMKVPEPIVLTSSTTAWTSGNVYTLGDEDVTTIASRITVSGSVGLLLPDGRKLTALKGITVTESNSLTINGGTGQNAGILEATGGDQTAGIGGDYYDCAGGTVTINGGTVTATGGKYAAGIGGGWDGTGGTVTINGGTVTATGGSDAAGIGGGYYNPGGTVTITGGSVTANGGQDAHGIGRGYGVGSDGTLEIGDGVHVYETGSGSPYANGPQDNVTTRYQNMTVNSFN